MLNFSLVLFDLNGFIKVSVDCTLKIYTPKYSYYPIQNSQLKVKYFDKANKVKYNKICTKMPFSVTFIPKHFVRHILNNNHLMSKNAVQPSYTLYKSSYLSKSLYFADVLQTTKS